MKHEKMLLVAALALLSAGCDISDIPGNQSPPTSATGGAPGTPPVFKNENERCTWHALHNYNAYAGEVVAEMGAFSVPFCEEKFLSDYPEAEIPDRGAGSSGQTNPAAPEYSGLQYCARRSEGKFYECKPSAGSIALLPDDRMVYFNALESTENVEFGIVKEFGEVAINDQTRLLSLGADSIARWSRPANNDGGAQNPTNDAAPGGSGDPVTGTSPNDTARNDGALFCAHLVNLYDGRVMAAGGTDYYTDTGGAAELEGLKNTRIYDPAANSWSQAALMNWGRWYPTLVTFANGNVFVASGVRKLLKPVYPDRPADESGRNETHVEIFQPGCNNGMGKWTDQGDGDSSVLGSGPRRSLPLFSRLHLLPNDEILYAAAGQAYNPQGQSYDQALTWDFMAVFNKGLKSWRVIGEPGSAPYPGFRGSTSNIMMPLVPDAAGNYNQVNLLTMGGTYGLSPGNPVPLSASRMETINLIAGAAQPVLSRDVGDLNAARWYGQGVLLPTGQVMLFSGGDMDEVIGPGTEAPLMDPELFDPVSETWKLMARQGHARTYHNSAFLMADGRIMVGGHAPISAGYGYNQEVPGKAPQGRDPSFEIYSPPYVFKQRPAILSLSANSVAPGATLTINTPAAASIVSNGYVVLVRRPAITHLVDGDQRNVVLKVLSSNAASITVQIPSNDASKNQAVLPPGHYMVFVLNKSGADLAPSVSVPLRVTGADLGCH